MAKVSVRHSDREDIADINKVYGGPIAVAGTLQLPFVSVELWKARLTTPAPGMYSFVAELDNQVVGHLGLSVLQNPRRKHAATVGMAVLDGYEQRGIGSALLQAAIEQSDNWLDISRIELTVFTDNSHAIALYKKFGFEVEGELQRFAFRNGEYVNAYQMARLRS